MLVGVAFMCILLSIYVLVSANMSFLCYYMCYLVLLYVLVSVNLCVVLLYVF